MSATDSNTTPAHRNLYLILLGIGVLWYALFRLIVPLASTPYMAGPMNGNDFKHIYIGSQMLAHGEDPYDPRALFDAAGSWGFQSLNPYVYLPFTGLVLSPLTLLDPIQALRAWFILNHLMAMGAVALLAWSLRRKTHLLPILTAGVLLLAFSSPWRRTLAAGQLNAVLLSGMALVFFFVSRKRPVPAGIVAAFCFLFKLWPGILLVYFGWRMLGEYRSGRRDEARFFAIALVTMLLASAAFLLASVALVGVEQHKAFLPLLREMSYGQSTWWQLGNQFYRDPYNQSFNALLHHLLVPADTFRPWFEASPAMANLLTRIAVCVVAALVAWRSFSWRGRRLDEPIVYSIYVIGALLVPSIYWDHYAVLLLIPLLAIFARQSSAACLAMLAMFLLLIFPTHFSGEILFQLAPHMGMSVEGYYTALIVLQIVSILCAGIIAFMAMRKPYCNSSAAILWAVGAALIHLMVPYSHGALKSGVGLLLMSSALWGTILVLGVCLWQVRERGRGEENV
ncbi:MAG: glycosyltransferase family 87 protein [Candidatus Sumerlaeota bacterium]